MAGLAAPPAQASEADPPPRPWLAGGVFGLAFPESASGGRPAGLQGGLRAAWRPRRWLGVLGGYTLSGSEEGSGPARVSTWRHRLAVRAELAWHLGPVRVSGAAGGALTLASVELGHDTPDAVAATTLHAGPSLSAALGTARRDFDLQLEGILTHLTGRTDLALGLAVLVPLPI